MTARPITPTMKCRWCGDEDHTITGCVKLVQFNAEVEAMAGRCPRCRAMMTAPERCGECGRHSDA